MSNLNSIKGSTSVLDNNSSVVALNNGQVFTGDWQDVGQNGSVIVAVKTDQDGTFSVQFSPDGINVDSTLTRYYRINEIEAPHRFTITRRYARVVFTNDSGANQTYFRLQTMIGDYPDLNAPADSTMAQDFDSTSVRPSEFKYEVAEGLRQGYETWNKWGYNADVDGATVETVWSVGGLFTPIVSAETLNVVSTSTDDDGSPAGTGAQSVIIYGVDANLDPQTEVVTMNGTTAVTTTSSWLGVNRVALYLAGATGTNVGNINVTATIEATTQAQIPAGEGSTQQAFSFVPTKHTALMDWLWINAVKDGGGGTPTVTVKCWVTSLVSGAKYEVFRALLDTARGDHQEFRPTQPFVIGEKSLIEFQASSTTNDTAVSVRFSYIQVRQKDANA